MLGVMEAAPESASAVGSHPQLCQRLGLLLSLGHLGHGGVQPSPRGWVGLEGAVWKRDGKKVRSSSVCTWRCVLVLKF